MSSDLDKQRCCPSFANGYSVHYSNCLRYVAEKRVYTNDIDALEALILEGLPPDEMQAAAWVLVDRVRGLRADLMRLQASRAASAALPCLSSVPESE